MDKITAPEAARLLGITRVRVWQLIKKGKLKAEKKGRDWWVDRESVEKRREGDD